MKTSEARRAAKKRWLIKNPEYHRTYRQKRLKTDPAFREKIADNTRKWRKSHPERIKKIRREYARKQRANPATRILESLRKRIWAAIKQGFKSARTLELLDMDLKEFRIYIQGQFRPGMTWENYGPVWHIDHVRPCASFDLTDPEQQKICFRWDNLQPLFKRENLQKHASYSSF